MPKYDAAIEKYRGEIPLALINGLIKSESDFNPKAVNSHVDAPGGGPKHGLMQPTKTGLKDLQIERTSTATLLDPEENIRIGCTILLEYLKHLRADFSGAFDRPLDQDANAAAVLVHAYTSGYAITKQLLQAASSTSYRTVAAANAQDRAIAKRWSDRVLDAARKYGYTQILPAGGALVPPSGGGGGALPSPPAGSSNKWLWLLGAAAAGGALYFATTHKKRRHA